MFEGSRRFVGFGFGAIQAGLFLYEAHACGSYARPLVVDVRADLVDALRGNAGRYGLNIARSDRVDSVEVGPIDLIDSTQAGSHARIIEAIAVADDASTALPSVHFYRTREPSSPHLFLAAWLTKRQSPRPLVVYCA